MATTKATMNAAVKSLDSKWTPQGNISGLGER
jgi:hypothetical protein